MKNRFPTTILLFFLFSILVNIPTFGQGKGTVKGVCIDQATGEALIGANIVIKGTAIGSSTDIDGAYVINGITAGTYTFIASYIGYEDVEKEFQIKSNELSLLDFEFSLASFLEEEIIVTAQAKGQMAAINQQLASKTITNIISAKKIQEIPTANAAEAVGRLPGVSIVRSGGEGNKVVVRGLSPKFNQVLVEGQKMAATGNDDRSVDMSMISPYMLEGIEVAKAAMPDKDADVIGGSVNFILRSAPDDPKMDVLLQTGYNSLKNQYGDYKLVVGGSHRFFNNKLGVFANLDIENRNRSSYELKVNYFNKTEPGDMPIDVSIGNLFVQDIDRDIDRYGGVFVMDYRLPNGIIKFINFASNINKNQTNRFENLRPDLRDHIYTIENEESSLFVMNNALRLNNNFNGLILDMGISSAYSQNKLPDGFSLSGLEKLAFDEGLDIERPPSEVAGFARNDISDANVSDILLYSYDTYEQQFAADINLEYNIIFNNKISARFKTGAKFNTLTKEYNRDARRIPANDGGEVAAILNEIAANFPDRLGGLADGFSKLPYSLFVDPNYNPENFLGGDYAIKDIPDLDFVDAVHDFIKDKAFVDHPSTIKDDYDGSEVYQAAYLLAEFQIGKTVTFTPGFRYEKNTTTYRGIRGNSGAQRWIEGYLHSDTTTTRNNSFLLPMVHLQYKPVKWFDLRLAYTKTLSRPNYNQIIPSWDITPTRVFWNNPFLLPGEATNYDVHASFHSNKLGLFAIGGFYKKIENLIFSRGAATIIKPEEFGLPVAETGGKQIVQVINNPFPVNLYGLEVEWQTRFWYLDNFLSGLIFNVNYTHTFSEVKYPRTVIETVYFPEFMQTNIDTFYKDRLILQPNDIVNITLGYDLKGFSARFSMLYQSDIFASTHFFERLRASSEPYLRFDLGMKQKIKIKEKDNLEVLLNISNLGNAIERNSNVGTGFPSREQHYGSTIDLGIRYRL